MGTDPSIRKDFSEILTNISTKTSQCSVLLNKLQSLLCVILSIREQKILLTLNDNFVHLWYHYHRQKTKDQLRDFLTLNIKRAPLEIALLCQLLSIDFLHSSIEHYAY